MAASHGIPKQKSLLRIPVLLLPVLLLLAFPTDGALTILNRTKFGFMIYHPPGCCSPFGWHDPPPGWKCARCPSVYLYAGKAKTLDKIVGPYPLQFLLFQGSYGKEYCVVNRNLTKSATLVVGPEECEAGVQAYVSVAEKPTEVEAFCLPLCF